MFRVLLIAIFLAIAIYTVPVVARDGLDLFPYFFGDIARGGWPGQFNVDFTCFLVLSALWTAWRHHFSAAGLALGLLAFFGGALFLSVYLLIASFQAKGDARILLLGPGRAGHQASVRTFGSRSQ